MTTESESHVHVHIDRRAEGSIARVTIETPKLNIIGSAVMHEFIAAVEDLAADADLRAVVLTGAGERAFIGGADIHEMAALDGARATEFITRLHRMCHALRELPVPVVARINGYALGAGLEIAAACDLRVASTTATFGMPEVRVGIPSVIEAALLPSLIGWGRTRELVLLGDTIDAQTALGWGLVQRVVEPAELDGAVDEWMASLFKAGPQAVRLQKRLMREWEDLPLSRAVQAGIRCFSRAYATDEPAKMMGAFINRRR